MKSTNKAVEAIYKLSLSKSFRKLVKTARESLGIPPEGFDSSKEELLTPPDLIELVDQAFALLDLHKLPRTYWVEMVEYIKYGEFYYEGNKDDQIISIEYPDRSSSDHEKTYKNYSQPYVKLFILDASTQEDVLAAIRKSWVKIKGSLKNQGGSDERVRKSLNKERNYLISILSERSKSDLAEMIGVNPKLYAYKEALVSEVMKQKYKLKVSADVVKKYSSRPRK